MARIHRHLIAAVAAASALSAQALVSLREEMDRPIPPTVITGAPTKGLDKPAANGA